MGCLFYGPRVGVVLLAVISIFTGFVLWQHSVPKNWTTDLWW